jgi:Rrf2 family protein
MKLITRDTDYAMRALLFIATRGSVASVPELVAELKIPRPFLRRILQTLARSGILESFKGNKGGFVLKKKPCDIRLGNVVTAFQGTVKLNDCLFKKKACPNRTDCLLRRQITDIERFAQEKFDAVTLETLLQGR